MGCQPIAGQQSYTFTHYKPFIDSNQPTLDSRRKPECLQETYESHGEKSADQAGVRVRSLTPEMRGKHAYHDLLSEVLQISRSFRPQFWQSSCDRRNSSLQQAYGAYPDVEVIHLRANPTLIHAFDLRHVDHLKCIE